MNLYTTLTLRYLKENKKRTIVTIIGKNIKLCFTSYNENDCFVMASPIIKIRRIINLEYNVVIRFLQGN